MSQHLFDARPPEESRARPLLAWSPRQLEALSQRIAAAWLQWLADWRPEGQAANVTCAAADAEPHVAARPWTTLGEREFATAWVHAGRDAGETISACLFNTDGVGPNSLGPVGRAVSTKAWSALQAALRETLQLDHPVDLGEPDAALFKPWAGAVTVSLRIGAHEVLSLLLDGACATALAPDRDMNRPAKPVDPKPLFQIQDAMSARRLHLQVALEPCELDLGALAQLSVGDVIPLPHSLDTPLHISLAGTDFCAGYLGRQGDLKAVQLARSITKP